MCRLLTPSSSLFLYFWWLHLGKLLNLHYVIARDAMVLLPSNYLCAETSTWLEVGLFLYVQIRHLDTTHDYAVSQDKLWLFDHLKMLAQPKNSIAVELTVHAWSGRLFPDQALGSEIGIERNQSMTMVKDSGVVGTYRYDVSLFWRPKEYTTKPKRSRISPEARSK